MRWLPRASEPKRSIRFSEADCARLDGLAQGVGVTFSAFVRRAAVLGAAAAVEELRVSGGGGRVRAPGQRSSHAAGAAGGVDLPLAAPPAVLEGPSSSRVADATPAAAAPPVVVPGLEAAAPPTQPPGPSVKDLVRLEAVMAGLAGGEAAGRRAIRLGQVTVDGVICRDVGAMVRPRDVMFARLAS